MHKSRLPVFLVLFLALVLTAVSTIDTHAAEVPDSWKREFPKADFSKSSVGVDEIMSGGPPRDGIPPIDNPKFVLANDHALPAREPVIGVFLNGEYRAYPLRILTWHEIVNDEINGTPLTVTYCPLCNAAIVFDRRLDGQVLDFGTTGKLRNSDLVMYDRQTDSFWQQAIGTGIMGSMTGKELTILPARLESWEKFLARADDSAKVLVPNNPGMRRYGQNPYVGYDSRERPYGFFQGEMPEDIDPMVRVVVVHGEAWSLPLVSAKGVINAGHGMKISWQAGQNSALDSGTIAEGRDVGNVVVTHPKDGGGREDVPYDITFAFVYYAFHPQGVIHQ